MDIGVVGRIGVLAAKHVMMANELDIGSVTTQSGVMVESHAQGLQVLKRCASWSGVGLVSCNWINSSPSLIYGE